MHQVATDRTNRSFVAVTRVFFDLFFKRPASALESQNTPTVNVKINRVEVWPQMSSHVIHSATQNGSKPTTKARYCRGRATPKKQ